MAAGSRMARFITEFTDFPGDYQNPPRVGVLSKSWQLSKSGGTLQELTALQALGNPPSVGVLSKS